MEEKSLSVAFGDSLKEDSIACISDLAEVGLDAIMEDGIFKDIPILSTAVAVYKIGSSIKERHNLKKLLVFLNEVNNGIVDKQKRKKYQKKFQCNEKFRNQEIEYLLVLIDRYINYDKTRMLAKVYLAYLEDRIVWEELTIYAEVIDRFLPSDCSTLISGDGKTIVHQNVGGESVMRLVALGLMVEDADTSKYKKDENGEYRITWAALYNARPVDKIYIRSEFGNKLANILK